MAVITSLVAYWSLDESSGSAIDAYGDNDLTDDVTVASTTGKVSNCRDFEADSAKYLYRTSTADLSMGDVDFSVQAWVQIESKSTTRTILAKFATASAEYLLQHDNSIDRFQFVVKTLASTFKTAIANNLGAPSLATWYLVHAWHDSVNNEIGIAVNAGTADTLANADGVQSGNDNFVLGLNNGSDNYWDGLIDEVGVWKKVLTSTERTWLYNSGNGRSYADIQAEAGISPGVGALAFTGPLLKMNYTIQMPDEA